ncbi:hypothetical protein LNKW23_41000 [Paralimibaculum aggregatum]|uniref:Uncharacterized protein n=1 Tax=Paralimibaculum aggregatum TaxID=3036245 RepID=A0ABQ6LS66_9RHOB|nr:hypothetical protein LNKW23_41000 [Limibaculum sp. NKW23]
MGLAGAIGPGTGRWDMGPRWRRGRRVSRPAPGNRSSAAGGDIAPVAAKPRRPALKGWGGRRGPIVGLPGRSCWGGREGRRYLVVRRGAGGSRGAAWVGPGRHRPGDRRRCQGHARRTKTGGGGSGCGWDIRKRGRSAFIPRPHPSTMAVSGMSAPGCAKLSFRR